jgi:hypothetical protein
MAITVNILGEHVQLSGNPVEVECTGGSAPAGSKNYQILLKVISQDGKLVNFPKTDAVTPNSAGKARFDISGYVDHPVKLEFQYPPSGAAVSYATQAYNVQVQAGETWMDEDGITQETWGGISDVFQVLKGGLSQRQLNMMRDASTNFYQFYLNAGKFFTGRPWGDLVHPTQPVKLWFMPIANASATLTITANYYDGTTDVYTTSVSLNTNNLYEINCNPMLLGIDEENGSGSKMNFFDVTLNGVSETRRFTVDWKHCDRPTFLFFANSLGGIDDVYFSGYVKDKFNVTTESAFKPATNTDTVFDPTIIVTNKSGRNLWSINTGWKSLTSLQYLRDLMVSRQAWYVYGYVTGTSFNIIPVIVDPGEQTLYDRKKDLWSLDLEISEGHTSQFTFDNRSY